MEQNNNGTEQGEKNQLVREVADKKYEYGFTTDVHTEIIERGLNEDVIRLISSKKGEPEWLLDFRLKAYRYWLTLEQPKWGHVNLPEIDYQAISYYADPTKKQKEEGSKEIDPELMKTFDKLGIPLHERLALSGVAIDAVMDSVSVKTTFKEKLQEKGIIFSSISEAVRENPELVRKYLGTVVPYRDNYSLRSIVPFSPTVPSFIFRAVFAVRWNSPPISASTRETRDSLSAPSLSATTVVTSLISKVAPLRCATKTSFMPPLSRLW